MTNDNNMNVKAPWIKSLGGIPAHLDYYKGSMYDRVAEVSENFPDHIAYDFMGGKVKYLSLIHILRELHPYRRLLHLEQKPQEMHMFLYLR